MLYYGGNIKPESNDHHVGVELEFLVPKDIEDNHILSNLVLAGIEDGIDLTTDGSINDEYDFNGVELRIIATQSQIVKKVTTICKVLRSIGCKVNSTCGLHVHLDMRNRNEKTSYKRLVDALPKLSKLVAKSRLKNTYCKLNKSANLDTELNSYEDRYKSINPHAIKKHKTIEVRLHQGSVDHRKVSKWIKTLVKTVDKAG